MLAGKHFALEYPSVIDYECDQFNWTPYEEVSFFFLLDSLFLGLVLSLFGLILFMVSLVTQVKAAGHSNVCSSVRRMENTDS